MDTWNLRETANFCTKISKNLFWIPSNSFELNGEIDSSKRLYNILYDFQMKNFDESSKNRILKLDCVDRIIWEFFDSPSEIVAKYKEGNCAVFSLWLNYFLSKLYRKTGYIQIIRSTGTWHILNYIKLGDWYYIIDPNNLIKKYKSRVPIENGNFKSYAKSNMITGGILKTTDLKDFISYYEKYVLLGGLEYLFLKIDEYNLPYFCIEHVFKGFKVYLNSQSKIYILNKYNKSIYKILYTLVDEKTLIPVKERSDKNIWELLMKTKNIFPNEKI